MIYKERDIINFKDKSIPLNMKRYQIVFFISILLVSSCRFSKYYTISSPDKTKCLTLQYCTSMIPGDCKYVYLYYGAGKINKHQRIKLVLDMVGGFAVDWGSTPVKIRGLFLENTIPTSLINIKNTMTQYEDSLFHVKGSLWRSYDYQLIEKGEYPSCK